MNYSAVTVHADLSGGHQEYPLTDKKMCGEAHNS